jgi:hypothetical protein
MVDLLLFHAEQVRYIVVELKVGKFRHEYAGYAQPGVMRSRRLFWPADATAGAAGSA